MMALMNGRMATMGWAMAGLILWSASTASVAKASVVLIGDTFTTGSAFAIGGGGSGVRVPETESPPLTGETYSQLGTWSFWNPPDISAGYATMQSAVGAGINLQSVTLPAQITVSADLELGSIAGADLISRGVQLGFYSAPADGGGNPMGFSGFAIQPGTGALVFSGNAGNGQSASFSGTFSNTSFYPVSFTVDTATGAVSNVVYNGVAETFPTLVLSTQNYVGFGVSGNGFQQYGSVDNFQVATTVVPEPTSLTLGLIGMSLMLRRRSRKQEC